MVKSYRFSTLIAVTLATAFSTGLGAWGQRSPADQPTDYVDTHFPLNANQAWALEESLLVWKTYEDDTDFAIHQVRSTDATEYKDSIKHPTFDWSTGVRLKLTRYIPSHDPWDVNVIATYYYDEAEKEVDVDFSTNPQNLLASTWDTVGFAAISEARATTHMNFFTFDLTAGRYYTLTRKIDIHPFIGIRSVLNYQTYKTTYKSTLQGVNPTFTPTKFKGEFDFWGIGPRVGTDISLRIGRHWSLLGTFGASLFAGRFDVREKFEGETMILKTFGPFTNKLKDNDTVLRSNIDASLGLGWEKWVRGGTVRIAPSFVFEVSEWFSMKRWIETHSERLSNPAVNPVVHTHRRYSDLGLMGFNVNLQVDF